MAAIGSSALSLFPRRVQWTDAGGFLTPEAIRALQALFVRVGGSTGDMGTDVFQPFSSGDDAELPALFTQALEEPALEPLPSQPVTEEKYAVGDIYITKRAGDPSALLGYGTWVAIEAVFLAAYKSGDPDFGTPGGTGGAKTTTVNTHASHTHQVTSNVTDTTGNFIAGAVPAVTGITNNTVTSSGPDAPLTHDPAPILPPYQTVYMWERTA